MFIEVETVERIKFEAEEIQKIEAVMELLAHDTPNNLPSKVETLCDEAYESLQRVLEYNGAAISYSTKCIDERKKIFSKTS